MPKKHKSQLKLEPDPLWYKRAVIYQCHVRSFCDSTGDGIGDFRGLTSKLDYLQDLGITAIWLLPFYPSPLKDDGYDTADYCNINPIYGVLGDFKDFLNQAHRRGLRVITELVINHTSDQHDWFQRARTAKPGSKWRNYYVWSETADKYREARIIFKDFETSNWTWDSVAGAYFWHRFYSHQPDLNFESPDVHREVIRALDFWLEMGVDGLRLDAIPYLYEAEGTNCENLQPTHDFLRKLRQYVDVQYGDRMLLAEANQWPEDAVAYFGQGDGDECHMAFHFPLMPRLFMALRMEDRIPIIDILEETPPIPATSQWALFLRNHDELTLEMVTDEERDYMYRVYADDPRARINLGIRRRLAPLLGNDRKRMELMNALLLSLPGTPVLYYGDEIGMGENTFLGDRNGVRTPMQWSSDKNAGFSRANPQSLYLPVIVDPQYHYETVNVEAQQANRHSLLWWTKRLLALRQQWPALGFGTLQFLHPENRKVLAYLRQHQNQTVLVVANLSRYVQPVELDLSGFQQMVPMEIFGQTHFPTITASPYFLSLGPHSFLWFSLESCVVAAPGMKTPPTPALRELPSLAQTGDWTAFLTDDLLRRELEKVLQGYVQDRRWFRSKAKTLKRVVIQDVLPVPLTTRKSYLLLLETEFVHSDSETYVLPLAFARNDQLAGLLLEQPNLLVARLVGRDGAESGALYDAVGDLESCHAWLDLIARRRGLRGQRGSTTSQSLPLLRQSMQDQGGKLTASIGGAEQSNSCIVFGDQFMLKVFRKLEPGINPDLEVGRFLAARKFPHVPTLLGSMEYQPAKAAPATLAILHRFIPNSQVAWNFALDALGRYYERILTMPAETPIVPRFVDNLIEAARAPKDPIILETVGLFINQVDAIARCTADMHRALASDPKSKEFCPEPFSPHYQRGLYQSMRNHAMRNLELLAAKRSLLPKEVLPQADAVLGLESRILKQFKAVFETRLVASRIRCHGDYHLGQLLYTGKEFVILDFEGEPARPLSERRIKQSSLKDVAGMLRSFHYAAFAALVQQVERGVIRAESMAQLEPWARYWYQWNSVEFLRSYFDQLGASRLLPSTDPGLRTLLEAFLLEKAMYELGYELNNRPAWVKIPLQGILELAGRSDLNAT